MSASKQRNPLGFFPTAFVPLLSIVQNISDATQFDGTVEVVKSDSEDER